MRSINLKGVRSLKDITLSEYASMIEVSGNAKEGDENDSAVAFVLALNPDLTKSDIAKIPVKTILDYMSTIMDVLYNEVDDLGEMPLFIKYKKHKFGLEPNLSAAKMGLFTDLQSLAANLNKDNILKIFALLYRPVTNVIGNKVYSITDYETEAPESIDARAEFLGEVMNGEVARLILVNFAKARMKS